MATRLRFPFPSPICDETTRKLLLTLSRLDDRFKIDYKKANNFTTIYKPGVY